MSPLGQCQVQNIVSGSQGYNTTYSNNTIILTGNSANNADITGHDANNTNSAGHVENNTDTT